jgi:hypothetical protein
METGVTAIEPNFNLDGYEVIGNVIKCGSEHGAIHCWRCSRNGFVMDNLRIHDNTGKPVVVANAPRGWEPPEPPLLRNNRNQLSDPAPADEARVPPFGRRVLVTAHDAFRYFGRAYGIEVVGVQGTSTESEAGLSDVNRLVDMVVTRGIPAVFVETSVSDRNVEALREGAQARGHTLALGGRLYSDSLGVPGSDADTLEKALRANVETIVAALQGASP